MDEETLAQIKKENKILCEKYPFLIPSNRWSGKRINSGEEGYWPGNPDQTPEWDYEFTELDDMPHGWRVAFGEQICDELKKELIEANRLDEYRITDIKEKFGYLRWYDNGCTEKWYKETLPKYEMLSKRTCIKCGAPATKISLGWISPFCDECAKSLPVKTEDIDKFYNGEESCD